MADTPPPEDSPTNNSPESQPQSPPPSSPPESSPPPESPPPSSPPPQSPSPSPPSPPPPEESSSQGSNASPPPPQSTNPNPSPPPPSKNNTPSAPSTHTNNNNNNSGENAPGVWKTPTAPRTANDGPAALRPASGISSKVSPPSDSSGSTVSVPLVVAVAVVAGIVVFALLFVIVLCCRRKKKKDAEMEHMQYYRDKNHAATQGAGGGQQRPTNWQNTNEMMNNIPPPPGGGWAAPSTPPHPAPDTNSSIFSSPQGFTVLPPPPPPMVIGAGQSNFTYEELAAVTNGFSEANMLGQGGFGNVHKGVLPNGKEIAVKSLKAGSGQGEREFRAEVEIISRVHHRHLVSLVGYCIDGDKRLLVYEFLPNNNLEFHLHGKGQPPMNFATRMKIALDSAKGLAYLHEDCHPRIIHRDIKSSNILLDFNFDAKVSDFGLARLNSENYTHVSTRVMGTFGYLAPEYASSGKLTEKSDVFSFGVMLLELITGRRPVDMTGAMEDSLVDWARPLCLRALEVGNFDELADPFLEKNFPAHEMARLVACASASIRHSAKRRPKMSQIVRALEGDVSLEDLNDGIKVANNSQFGGSTTSGVGSNASLSDLEHYGDEMKRIKKMTADSGPFPYASSEFGATSEYGLNLSTSSSESGSRNDSPTATHI